MKYIMIKFQNKNNNATLTMNETTHDCCHMYLKLDADNCIDKLVCILHFLLQIAINIYCYQPIVYLKINSIENLFNDIPC
jgi:hypothetical protein